jgi:sugar O-acyltransferase (sialic acid O-acetyltransferase NeuD family)
MDKPVIIFGANAIGKAAYEIFTSNEILIYCFLDDRDELIDAEINDVRVMGKTDDDGFLKYIGHKCEAFVATDDNELRKSIVEMLINRREVMPVNASHQKVVLSTSCRMGHGNFINAGTILGTDVKIGNHCIIHTNSVLEYGVEAGDFVQIGTGAIINPEVKIADEVFIGSGVTIVSGVNIGAKARIGAGSVVISDVNEGETIFGNPAKPIE